MRLFWWQQLPLLILIQLLEPSRLSYKIYAEALLACKGTVGSPWQFSGRLGRYSYLRQRVCVDYDKLKDRGVVSLLPKARPFSPHIRTINLSPFAPKFYLSHTSIQSQAKLHKTRNVRIRTTIDGGSGVPTLTTFQEAHVDKPRKRRLAAIIGGIGTALLVVLILALVYICLMRVKKFLRQTTEMASVQSPPVEWDGGNTAPQASTLSPYGTMHLRQLTILELEHATSNFSPNNIIGEGGFGLVYKGLLHDGSIVAIKRRLHTPTHYFVHEVKRIARVQHDHIVKLIGYCEENHQQLLVYDYLHNGNVGNHLYDNEGLPIARLEIWQRLLIAVGAAKGLEYLHGLVPPHLHMHFRTSNVLVDENFIAKVSDFGLSRLLTEGDRAGSSSTTDFFLDPELRSSKNFSETSDVYSFGVFLLELITGREAHGRNRQNSQQNLVLQAKSNIDLHNFADKSLGEHSMHAVKEMMGLALACIDTSLRRPTMKYAVEVLERIVQSEIVQINEEEIGAVTLGSELFK